jgi:hypothetical protein
MFVPFLGKNSKANDVRKWQMKMSWIRLRGNSESKVLLKAGSIVCSCVLDPETTLPTLNDLNSCLKESMS